MLRIRSSQAPGLRAQRGMILVTALLLLVVLTIIGVTVMQMSRMQERMVGNTREVNIAFQAAETALRGGEARIRAQKTSPLGCSAAPCEFWLKDSMADIASKAKPWWLANGTAFVDASGQKLTGVAQSPRYIIEQLGFVRTDGGVETGLEQPVGREFYQITAQSTGATDLADTVVQSTYTRKY